MKALSFLEWVIKRELEYANGLNDSIPMNIICKVANFYNQPFSVDMLVNPIILETTGEVVNGKYAEEWQQSESLRLFDGWEIDNEVRCYRCYDGEQYSKYPIVHFNGYEGLTLNDFIVIFTRYNKGKLQWNESNEKVKEVFK